MPIGYRQKERNQDVKKKKKKGEKMEASIYNKIVNSL